MEKQRNSEAEKYILGKAIDYALAEIGRKYENPADPENYLYYHVRSHTLAVIRRTSAIMSAIKQADSNLLCKNDENIAKFASAFHDIVQRNGSPRNEKESAEIAVSFALKMGLFTESEEEKIKEAILATIPAFDPQTKTVYQPNLSSRLSIPALALAVADINGAGIDGPDVFTREGNRLFWENKKNLDRKNILDWSEIQVNFAEGRKKLFQREIQLFPSSARSNIGALFSTFDASIAFARANMEKRSRMNEAELINSVSHR